MREARGNGKEDLEGKRPRNNPPNASPNFTCSLAKVRPGIHTCQVQTSFGCPCKSNMLTLVSFLKTIVEIEPKLRDLGKLS